MIVYIGYNTSRGGVISKFVIPDTVFALLELVTKFVNLYRQCELHMIPDTIFALLRLVTKFGNHITTVTGGVN